MWTFVVAVAAIRSITLVPVMMGWMIRGKIPPEERNPIKRALNRAYRPGMHWVMRKPKTALVIAGLIFLTTAIPLIRPGGAFLPPPDEGDHLYMPNALPGRSEERRVGRERVSAWRYRWSEY